MQYTFGRSANELSVLIKATLNHVYNNFGHLLRMNNVQFMLEPYLGRYANAIHSLDLLMEHYDLSVDLDTIKEIVFQGIRGVMV